jgi:pimeloyl-ACP methyl ester carboxylesterase
VQLEHPVLAGIGILLGLLVVYVMTVGFVVTGGLLVGLFLARGDAPDDVQAAAFNAIQPKWSRRMVGQIVETLIAAFDLALRFLYLLRLLPKLKDPGSGTPIVLLPGFTENAGALWWFARRLAQRGFRPFLIDFPSTFTRLDTNVAFLGMRLRQLRAATGHDQVAIVAHSMGGVIARAHMLTDPDHGVLTLIALASPFRGTHLARLGAAFRFGYSSLDMCPNSEFACRFPPSAMASAPIHSIVGCQENIVSPMWSCVLPGCDTHVLSLPVGHDAVLHLDEAYLRLESWLLQDGVEPAEAEAVIAPT